jgi:hypothetical protein
VPGATASDEVFEPRGLRPYRALHPGTSPDIARRLTHPCPRLSSGSRVSLNGTYGIPTVLSERSSGKGSGAGRSAGCREGSELRYPLDFAGRRAPGALSETSAR